MKKTNEQVEVGCDSLVSRLFGVPIWIEMFDGTLLKRRARFLPDGRIVATKIHGQITGNADGTFSPKSYCERWFSRESMFG